jgi:predicted deacetylase
MLQEEVVARRGEFTAFEAVEARQRLSRGGVEQEAASITVLHDVTPNAGSSQPNASESAAVAAQPDGSPKPQLSGADQDHRWSPEEAS